MIKTKELEAEKSKRSLSFYIIGKLEASIEKLQKALTFLKEKQTT